MRKQLRRFVYVLAAICMFGLTTFVMEPQVVYADTDTEDENLDDYELKDEDYEGDWAYGTNVGGAYILGYRGDATEIIVPDEYEGRPITGIYQGAFKDNTEITKVIFPASMLHIGDAAFKGCTELSIVEFGENCDFYTNLVIGKRAFKGCTSLAGIAFPDNISEIRDSAFEGCTNLNAIEFPNLYRKIELYQYAFKSCNNLSRVNLPGGTTFPLGDYDKDTNTYAKGYTFEDCVGLETVVLANGISEIAEGMFSGCVKLNAVNIPDSVALVGEKAFINCHAIESISLPNSVSRLEKDAFNTCSELTEVEIPESVLGIGEGCFKGCVKLEAVTFSGMNLRQIWGEAFAGCEKLQRIDVPYGTETVGPEAFSGCSKLTGVWLPPTITTINEDAFKDCAEDFKIHTTEGATDVKNYSIEYRHEVVYDYEIPEFDPVYEQGEERWSYRISEDGEAVAITGFEYTGKFSTDGIDLEVPASIDGKPVTEIGSCVFLHDASDVSLIRKVIVPDGVTRIGNSAFNLLVACKIWLPASVESISSDAFAGCADTVVIYTPGAAETVIDYARSNRLNYVIPITDLSFGSKAITLIEGDDKEVPVVVLPANTTELEVVEWSSDNTDAADVDSVGLIMASEPGTATITVSYTNALTGEVVEDTCKVTVIKDPNNKDDEDNGDEDNKDEDSGKDKEDDKDKNPGTVDDKKPSGGEDDKKTDDKNPGQTTPQTSAAPESAPAVNGTTLTDTSAKCDVKVISDDKADPQVAYVGASDKKATKVTVPEKVTIDGVTYKVTSIADKAFSGNKNLKTVTVGSNITTIGKSAFKNCKNLQKVEIKSKNITKIGADAFSGNKKLTKIVIKSTKIKSIGKNALKGTSKKLVIKVPKSKLKEYKKLFKNKGNKNVKVTK